MAVVPDAGEPLSPQAADLVRLIARAVLDEPADLMAEVYAAVSAAADEPLRSEPVLAAEVAASTRANVLHWAASTGSERSGSSAAAETAAYTSAIRSAGSSSTARAIRRTRSAACGDRGSPASGTTAILPAVVQSAHQMALSLGGLPH